MSAATVVPLRRQDHAPSAHVQALEELDALFGGVGEAQVRFLRGIARLGASLRPSQEGCRDLPHLISCRFGIPYRTAGRLLDASRAVDRLPRMVEALREGELSLEKFLELARFATAEDEEELLEWATGVTVATIRWRADQATRPRVEVDREAHRSRRLDWWFDDDRRRFELFASLPAAEGAAVARAIEDAARTVPVLPGEEGPIHAEARRADALVAMARSHLASAEDADRAAVVVHARWDTLTRGKPGAELEGGPVIHPETARRLACTSRIEILFEDAEGRVLARALRRQPPAWMVRQLLHRDRGCVFPGCGRRRHVVIHHLKPFGRGGPTTLENCGVLCTFHHVLVHELGWGLRRVRGRFVWTRPNGMPYQAGPSPPC